MKIRSILICCLFLLLSAHLYAGYDPTGKKHRSGHKTSLADPGEGNYDITDRLTFVAGLRYSYEDRRYQGSTEDVQPLPLIAKAHFDAFTPRFSLKYRVADETNVYFTYSKGFKSGFINIGSPFNVVDPEKINAYEVGYKTARGRWRRGRARWG